MTDHDDHSAPDPDSSSEETDDVHESISGTTKAAGEAAKAITEGIEGHGAAAVASGAKAAAGALETIAGAIPDTPENKETREVLEGVATGLEAAGTAATAIGKGLSGDTAGGLAAGGAGAASLLNSIAGELDPEAEREAREALRAAATAAETAGRLAEAVGRFSSLGSEDGAEHESGGGNVEYHVEVAGNEAHLTVRSFHLDDGVDSVPTCAIQVACDTDTFENETLLLDKDVTFTAERGEHQRLFRGIITRAHVSHDRDHQIIDMHVVPALWLLSETRNSRVFQDKTVPELVEELVEEYLGTRHRTVRSELTEDYPQHEYLVQYRESHLNFIQRLCDEEGIFLFFDHDDEDGEHEVLVLADSNDNRPNIENDDEGRIQYTTRSAGASLHGVAYNFTHSNRVGATDAVVSGYDWTNPPLTVRHEATERGEWTGPTLETHEHHHALRHHEYDEGAGQYQSNTAQRIARMSTERHDFARRHWRVETNAITVEPGHVIELVGADTHDGRYVILSVRASGATSSSSGGYHATLELIPVDMPYRPPTPVRPVMPGPETATVVGPSGEEIHCDKHGRVKVQFHWDRLGERDDQSGPWIRVTQAWAGAGYGAMFIPRIGHEVIVSFLGGDPDRPIITGCVYNGNRPVPYPLPEHKTRSTIMTNSSPGKNGFNELRFEDKNGEEEVYIHAEKDFNEEVKNCHSTHVGVDQSNTVDHDQTERIKHDQTLTVDNDRMKKVKGNQVSEIGETACGFRHSLIFGDEKLIVDQKREESICLDDHLTVTDGNKFTDVVKGKWDITSKGEFKVVQNSVNEFYMQDTFYLATIGRVQLKSGEGVHYNAEPGGRLEIKNTDKLLIESASDQQISSTGGNIKLHTPQTISLTASTKIELECGGSKITLSPSGIEIAGPTVKINADAGATEIDAATQVKIKC